MARMLSKGQTSKKNQGRGVTGSSLSSTNVFPPMRELSRGLGTSYAMAINKFIDEAPQMKGSTNGFLGKEKKTMNASDYGTASWSLFPKDFNPRKK
jgi:hypothetical protein